MALKIIIRNEEDAWKWLKKALDADPELDGPIDLKFDGWPNLNLHYAGHDYDQSIPTRIMPPLLDAQREINRLYSQVRFGESNLRKLSADDRDRLELVVKVNKGSSKYDTNLAETFTEIAKAAVNNMDSIHIVTFLISGAVLWGSLVGWKSWLQHQENKKEIDSRIQMSDLEKQKMELLTRTYKSHPETKEIAKGADDFRNDSLHKLKQSDSFTLPGSEIEISGEYAAEVTHTPREQSVEQRIDGEFVIQNVSSGETTRFKVKVKRLIDGKAISVSIPDGALSPELTEILKNNEWAKNPILMELNAKLLRGVITSATLVSASNIRKN